MTPLVMQATGYALEHDSLNSLDAMRFRMNLWAITQGENAWPQYDRQVCRLALTLIQAAMDSGSIAPNAPNASLWAVSGSGMGPKSNPVPIRQPGRSVAVRLSSWMRLSEIRFVRSFREAA